jgi:uncharacterized membrane protein
MSRRKWTNEEIAKYREEHGGFGYFNKDDSRVFVPKAFGYGITFNWANPLAWLVIAALIVVIVCVKPLL